MKPSRRRVWLIVLLIAVLTSVPAPPTRAQEPPTALTPYILPNEQVYTLQPALRYKGRLYQIHYFTSSSFNRTDPRVIGFATPETFASNEIAGLLITADDQVIEDETTIREIFSLYRAAYNLYQAGTTSFTDTFPFDEFRNDLRKITINPAFYRR